MSRPVPEDSIHPHSLEEWRAWLEANHATSEGVWLLTWGRQGKEKGGAAEIDYEEQVCEALCFGWIDSQTGKTDDGRMMQRFTPRRRQSNWTKFNKVRVERMIAEGRMRPEGLAEVERAKADGRWTLLDDADALVVPPDLRAALDALPSARANYEAFPPSARRQILSWIALAKTPTTRAKRVQAAAEKAALNERAF